MNNDLLVLLEKGYSYQQQGDLIAAKKNYLKVLKRDKNNEFALNLMGVVCIRTERFEDAVRHLRKAVGINSKDPETFNNLGLAYKELKQFDDARTSFEISIRLNAKQPVAINNLGNVLAAVNNHEEAIAHFESALSMDRKYVDCLNNLAMSLKEVERLEDALNVLEHAIRADNTRSLSYNNKGDVLLRATRYEQAIEAFDQAVALDGNIVARINISTAMKQLGDEKAALKVLQDVIATEENNTEAHNHLGVLLEQMGDTNLAAKHFRLALKHSPNHASSFYQLSRLKDHSLTQREVDKIQSLLKDVQLPDFFRASLLFAIAWDYESRKDYLTSIDYFIEAQAVKARLSPYDEAEILRHRKVSKQVFPVTWQSNGRELDDLPAPIFVVGMPRSGTTLTEQIVASHSEITGAGEVVFVSDMLRQASELTSKPYPESFERMTNEQARQLRKSYLTKMVERFGSNQFVVDKSPGNFNFIGAITAVFPEAKILYCKRDPMDNCVSIFRLPFDDNQKWAHGLEALGHYYLQHEKMMDYWQSCYPNQILKVDYEDTVGNLDTQARRILDFLGVEFQAQVLDFYENKRIVMTPSSEQVRQPIYKTSINAWQRYGAALDPLAKALGQTSGH